MGMKRGLPRRAAVIALGITRDIISMEAPASGVLTPRLIDSDSSRKLERSLLGKILLEAVEYNLRKKFSSKQLSAG